MLSSPSQVGGNQATAQRRHHEILSGVQAERQAALARAASETHDSISVALGQRAGQLLIAAGQWLGGLMESTSQQIVDPRLQS